MEFRCVKIFKPSLNDNSGSFVPIFKMDEFKTGFKCF